jgi:lipoprotein signal peptidase
MKSDNNLSLHPALCGEKLIIEHNLCALVINSSLPYQKMEEFYFTGCFKFQRWQNKGVSFSSLSDRRVPV